MTAVNEPATHPDCLPAAELQWQDDVPVATAYGDPYFSRQDGVAESLAVFLDGSDLPARWRGRDAFTVAELGFGSGLNLALTRQAFLQTAAAGSRLHFISFEAHPLHGADQQRLATAIGQRAPGAGAFLRRWADQLPPRLRGWHQRSFDGGRIQLHLYYGQVADGLADWLDQPAADSADAWYLDGFAPGRNPQMWQPELFQALARLSQPGATVASFSVAGMVRRGLLAAGFELERVPGPLGKRQVLRGRLRSEAAPPATRHMSSPVRRVAVIGAGLAGACTAHACARQDISVDLFAPRGLADAASANPWAVLHPRLPLDAGPRGRWLASAWHYSLTWLDRRPGWRPAPVLQLPEARRPSRLRRVHDRFRASGDWLALEQLGELTGLRFAGGHADLPRLIESLVADPRIRVQQQDIAALDQALLAEHDAVVVATGSDPRLLPAWLPLGRMRGQLDRTHVPQPQPHGLPVLTGRGHALALTDGWVAGASYQRDGNEGPATRTETDANMNRLQHLLDCLQQGGHGPLQAGEPTASFVGVRAHLPDRLPAVGPLDDGRVWLNCGHGSSGLLSCPLSAAWLAARLARRAPVLDLALQQALAPTRYAPKGSPKGSQAGLPTASR